MKTIAFHLQKGGVGKTSLSGTMAYEASLRGKTILIDCDPQGSVSSWLLSSAKYELAHVLTGDVHAKDAIEDSYPNLDVLASCGLDGGLKLYGESKLADEPYIFVDLFKQLEQLGYDYAIADMSPGMGRLERAVLTACDEVITPMVPEYFALDGIEIFRHELSKLEKNMRRAAKHNVLVLNAYDARIKQHGDISEAIKKMPYKVITVPVDPVFRKSQVKGVCPQKFGNIKPQTSEAIKMIGDLIWH